MSALQCYQATEFYSFNLISISNIYDFGSQIIRISNFEVFDLSVFLETLYLIHFCLEDLRGFQNMQRKISKFLHLILLIVFFPLLIYRNLPSIYAVVDMWVKVDFNLSRIHLSKVLRLFERRCENIYPVDQDIDSIARLKITVWYRNCT